MIPYRPILWAFTFLLGSFLILSTAFAQTEGDGLNIREGRTVRGIRYALLLQPFENTVALTFSWWDGFAQAQPGRELLGQFGAAWFQAGTERLPEGQFREELRDDHISLTLATGNRITGGTLSAPAGKLDLAAERLREVLWTPALSERALARLQRRQALNLEQAREVPGTLARSFLIELLAGQNPFAMEQASASLRLRGVGAALGRADVEDWRRAVHARDNLVVGAAGRGTEQEFVAAIDRAFGDLPERANLPPPPMIKFRRDARTVVIERPVSQTSLVLGAGSGFLWADERDQLLNSIALNAFAAGPSSRLFRVVRDELGAAYGITAELPMLAGAARYLVISTSVDPTSAPKALNVIRSEYDRFRQNGLTAAEFEAARARTVNGLEEGARRASAAASLLHGLLRQDRSATEAQGVLERLRKRLTREEVNARLLERWPAPPLTTIIVAPSGDGFAADCVVRRSEEPERCFLER